MPETVSYDLKTARKYKNRAGEEKTAWTTVGRMFSNKEGSASPFKIYLDALPIATGEEGRVEMVVFMSQPREEGSAPSRESAQRGSTKDTWSFEDDLK